MAALTVPRGYFAVLLGDETVHLAVVDVGLSVRGVVGPAKVAGVAVVESAHARLARWTGHGRRRSAVPRQPRNSVTMSAGAEVRIERAVLVHDGHDVRRSLWMPTDAEYRVVEKRCWRWPAVFEALAAANASSPATASSAASLAILDARVSPQRGDYTSSIVAVGSHLSDDRRQWPPCPISLALSLPRRALQGDAGSH